jgi:hypothetical protein
MNQARLNYERRSRFLAALLGASLFAGCQPAGTGSITVDGTNPAVRSLKPFQDVKATKTARNTKKPAGTKSESRAGLQ